MELILQNHLHTRQRGIATAFTQSVHRHMESLRPTQHSSQRVRHCQVVVVMGMEVKVGIGIALDHLAEILYTLQGVHDAKRVGEHKSTNTDVTELVHQVIDIRGRVFHTVTPVLQIEVHSEPLLSCIPHLLDDVVNMLLRCLVKLLLAVAKRSLCQ